MKRLLIILLLTLPGLAQATPEERGQEIAIRRKAGAYTVTRSEEVYLANNYRFELSDAGWQAMLLASDRVTHGMGWWPRYVNEFAKRMGWADIAGMENSNNMEGAAEAAQGFKDKVVIHLKDDGVKWTKEKAEKYIQMAGTLVEFIGDSHGFTPNSGRYIVTFVMTPKVNDIAVAFNKADGSFVVKAPSELEPPGWDTKMRTGLMRGGKFRY